MNIKDFLIDNYIWILAIILITIITIIGFLADKKKNNKKKEKVEEQQPITPNVQPNLVNNQMPLQYQEPMMQTNNMTNNNALGFQLPEQTMTNNISQTPAQMVMPNISQPIENNAPVLEPQSMMYQPLPDQTPILEQPQPMNNLNMNNNIQPLEQPIQQSNIINNSYNNSNMVMPQQTIPEPVVEPTIQQMPIYNNPSPTPNMDNLNIMSPNNVPNQMMNQQPVNPINIPQPVIPQPIMSQPIAQYNQPQPMMNQQPVVNQQPMANQAIPNNQQTVQPQPMTPNGQSLNFVYGASNNNQNM